MGSIARDVTKIREAEENYRNLFEKMPDGYVVHEIIRDDDGRPVDYRIISINPAMERIAGLNAAELVGKRVSEAMPGTKHYWFDIYKGIALSGEPATFVNHSKDLDKYFEVTVYSPAENRLACIFQDITLRRKAEEDKDAIAAQLLLAQKMEAIGRLAGGVSHDFNNMLSVILGNTEMAMDKVAPSDPLHKALKDIMHAAERSADLTRQLLAFARKQTVNPKVLNLNDTVSGMFKMLRRLIGEDIDLGWNPGPGLWNVRIDQSQVDQILANLMVNARDAIEKTGRIVIETSNIICDEAYCSVHPECIVGEYVMLTVSDDGSGMDKEVQTKIFDPFFTTKKEGQGTGLGLATVYGIVRQNSGHINVYSEPGKGTTFRIYLPRCREAGSESSDNKDEKIIQGGSETILLVEDEEAVMTLSKGMLERLGYRVLAVRKPDEAIRIVREFEGNIDLLFTDVVMPDMNGKDLSERISSIRPGLKNLYMSGYTADVIARQGILYEGVHFIPKPFSLKDLAAKVRESLK